MTKQEMLKILRLLSAMESFLQASKITIPQYLCEDIDQSVAALEKDILK